MTAPDRHEKRADALFCVVCGFVGVRIEVWIKGVGVVGLVLSWFVFYVCSYVLPCLGLVGSY